MRDWRLPRRAWLSRHPDRDEYWLAERLADGFDLHHLDGDPGNNDPENLVLIEANDHRLAHGMKNAKRVDWSHARRARREEAMSKARDAYWIGMEAETAEEAVRKSAYKTLAGFHQAVKRYERALALPRLRIGRAKTQKSVSTGRPKKEKQGGKGGRSKKQRRNPMAYLNPHKFSA